MPDDTCTICGVAGATDIKGLAVEHGVQLCKKCNKWISDVIRAAARINLEGYKQGLKDARENKGGII